MKHKEIAFLTPPQTLSGGVIGFQVEYLEKFNGFRTDLGMNGKNIGYGEEDEIQHRMFKAGIKLVYDPQLVIYHVVAQYKLSVSWFLKSYYALGRDLVLINGLKRNFKNISIHTMLLLTTLLINITFYSFKLLNKKYFFENWCIDVFKKPTKRLSILIHLTHNGR